MVWSAHGDVNHSPTYVRGVPSFLSPSEIVLSWFTATQFKLRGVSYQDWYIFGVSGAKDRPLTKADASVVGMIWMRSTWGCVRSNNARTTVIQKSKLPFFSKSYHVLYFTTNESSGYFKWFNFYDGYRSTTWTLLTYSEFTNQVFLSSQRVKLPFKSIFSLK